MQPSAIALPSKSLRPLHKPKGAGDVDGGPMKDYDELVDDSKNERLKCDIITSENQNAVKTDSPVGGLGSFGGRLPLCFLTTVF